MANRRQKGRIVNGILLLDKPKSISSNQILQRVKWLFKARKAGHTGSLDPLATGLLPLCFGEATKLSAYLLDADKKYRVHGRLGTKTDTADAEGEILQQRDWSHVGETRLADSLEQFRGEIQQLPPMYSAVKHNGQRLYKLAREGIQVERQPRLIRIYQLELVACALPEFVLEVSCSKGTYVRTLVDDLGDLLGCGAFVTDLRRTAVGGFDEVDEPFVTVAQIEQTQQAEGEGALDGYLLSPDQALKHWPDVCLAENALFYLRQGQPVRVPKAPADGWVRLFDRQGRFFGVGEIDDEGRVAPRRLLG